MFESVVRYHGSKSGRVPDLDTWARPNDPGWKSLPSLYYLDDAHLERLLSATIRVHHYFGWHIYDLTIHYSCLHCGNTTYREVFNASPKEISNVVMAAGTSLYLFFSEDAPRFMYDISDGAYSPEGEWVEWPTYRMELEDLEASERMKKQRRVSQTEWLAQWFVREILRREWTLADYRGQVMKHAKITLADHELDDICGCLEAIRDGVLEGANPTYITIVNQFEPPFIEQWKAYKQERPPVYLEEETRQWIERTQKHYGPVESSQGDHSVRLLQGQLRLDAEADEAG